MKLKLLSITLLIMLLLAPVGQMVYAQDTGDDDTGDDGTGDDGTGDTGGDTNSTYVDPDTNTTIPLPDGDDNSTDTGDEGEGDGNIDPLVYQQIRNTAQLRYQELYALMFGTSTPSATNETDTGDDLGDNSTEPETPDENTTYTGPSIPEDTDPALRNMFLNAWRAMEQAENEDMNPQAAANAYMRALKQMRNAYRKYESGNPDVADALNTTDGGEIPEDEIPDEPTDDEITGVQQQLVERFQERFQDRLTEMYENYNNVSGTLSADDAVKALNALTKAEQKLLRIQARLDAGNYTGAVDDLDDAEDEMEDDFDSLNSTAASQMFKTMNKLEERIQKMEEKAAQKAARGEDTSEEDALLSELKGNKNKTSDDFKTKGNSGNSNGNSNKDDKETGKPDKEEKDTGKPEKKEK